MRVKYLCTVVLSALLLALFLPVFYSVVFIGNRMNYNELHKIAALYPNTVLLLFAVLGAVLTAALCLLLNKIPCNRYTAAGVVVGTLIGSIIFYAVNVKISKCIAFYGGWDCGMVANSARWVYEGKELGHGNYYTVFPNNVPVTWLLYELYGIAKALDGYPYNPEFIWIQFQCAMYAAAVFFSAMTVLFATRRIAPAVLSFLTCSVLIGLSPWKVVPYTDASTVAAPVLVLFLYVLFLRVRNGFRNVLWTAMVFAGVTGGIFKATCYVALIGIVLVELVWLLFRRVSVPEKLKAFALRAVLFAGAFLAASYCKNGMYETLHYEYDHDVAISWSIYLYGGLNEDTTGACSSERMDIVDAYEGQPRYIREMVVRQYIKDRLMEKGFGGLLDFWLRKQVMNFNDGTFSWFQEGAFNAWEYEDITDSGWKEPLRDFYWEDGKNYQAFVTVSQGLWLFVLLGIAAEAALVLAHSAAALRKKAFHAEIDSPQMLIRITGIVYFIGIFLFVMLFEGRARYLFNSVPVFVVLAVMGYWDLAGKVKGIRRRA